MRLVAIAIVMMLSGCSGMNPNPGERTADTAWEMGNYDRAFEVASVAAERGEPWAQLRMGMYYDAGYGTNVDTAESVKWYTKAARQYAEGMWAEGYIVGATGKPGYFGQKNDAIIAMFRLADLYYKAEGIQQDLELSYLLISYAIEKMDGEPQVFFCCDWSGGLWFRLSQFIELRDKLEADMSAEDMARVQEKRGFWSPSVNL